MLSSASAMYRSPYNTGMTTLIVGFMDESLPTLQSPAFPLFLRPNFFPCLQVLCAAGFARSATLTIELQSNSAGAHPAAHPRRISIRQRVVRNIARHHRAGADKRVSADGRPTDHRTIRAQRCAFANQRRFVLILARHMATRVDHVSEHH